MADENISASLRPTVSMPSGQMPSLHMSESLLRRVVSLPKLAVQHHPVGILTTIMSASACVWCGYAELSVIDPLIFKSIFIIFGFTMGFRNVRANQRYFDAMHEASKFFAGFWGIYGVMPAEPRRRTRHQLLSAVKDSVAHMHKIGTNRRYCWYGMVGLEPSLPAQRSSTCYGSTDFAIDDAKTSRQEALRETRAASNTGDPKCDASDGAGRIEEGMEPATKQDGESTRAVLGPRIQLLHALTTCEAEIELIEHSAGHQKLRRNFWLHKGQLLESYDNLLALAFPSVTERFMVFVDICLFMFAVALPWGITSKSLRFHAFGLWKVGSGLVLVLNTTLVVMVLFSLNALTLENEDPLSGDSDDVDLQRLVCALELSVEACEKVPC